MSKESLEIDIGSYLLSPAVFLSLEAQGLLLRLRMIARTSDRRGYLSFNGLAIPPAKLALQCGTPLEQFDALFPELSDLLRRNDAGVWYDPTMLTDSKKQNQGAARQAAFRQRQKEREHALRNALSNVTVTHNVTDNVTPRPSLDLSLLETLKEKEKERSAPLRNAECNALEKLVSAFVPDPDWGDKQKAKRNAMRTALNLIDKLGGVEAAAELYKAAFEKKPSSSLAILGQMALDIHAKKTGTVNPRSIPGKEAYEQYG